MLPVVRGEDETRRQIFAVRPIVLFGATLLLVPGRADRARSLVTAVRARRQLVYRALRLWRDPSDAEAWALFKFSGVLPLGALFAAVAIDALV